MTREDKIKAIDEKVADKTLSFGCKINWRQIIHYVIKDKIFIIWHKKPIDIKDIFKIIWHPVMIWDVLDYYDKNILNKFVSISKSSIWIITTRICEQIIILWGYKRKPIEEQSDECINYIYDLIK